MKPFNLEKVKAGVPVVTRDGRPARIICFDRKNIIGNPIVALISNGSYEEIIEYTLKGETRDLEDYLFMKPEKKTGWVNIYPNNVTSLNIYSKEEDAILTRSQKCVGTIKIEWEE